MFEIEEALIHFSATLIIQNWVGIAAPIQLKILLMDRSKKMLT